MIVLESTQTLTITLASPVVADECSVVASFRDIPPSSTGYTPGSTVSQSNGVTPAAAVPPPASGTRLLDNLTVRNLDSAPVVATLRLTALGGPSPLWSGTLFPEESVSYVQGRGWQKLDEEGGAL
jgi:hypothetical protein